MISFPSKVLVIADYANYHFEEALRSKFDFVLACGDVPFNVFDEIYNLYRKPIFAVKGNHDPVKPFPKCVEDVHRRIVQHRNWLIGGWPVVVRAHINPSYNIDCGLTIPDPGTVPGFNARYCTPQNDTNNYPVHSGYNSLSDTSEGLPPSAGNTRLQDGYLVSFDYPISSFSLWFADWGDYFPNPNSVEVHPSYIKLIAYDKYGNLVTSAQSVSLNAVDNSRDAAYTNGIINLGLSGSGIRKVEVLFKGKIDPGVTIDDITFSGEMSIDIKPGSFPNCFNSNEHRVIPVAILGSVDFDVTTIDPFTVTLNGQGVRVKGKSGNAGAFEDVNGDGFLDLVVQIVDDGVYFPGDTIGIVTAYSYSGVEFQGQDSICIR